MNLNKNISTENEFNALYAIIYREFLKIANGQMCNALAAYDNIFVISISEGTYSEKLYWLIGDFLFACAKERRRNILKATDWLEVYCKEFDGYSTCLMSINALCSFLNELLIKNANGRKIDEFGYLLWERCVIQQIECVKGTMLGDEMLKQIEKNHPYFLSALMSLKKIIPNAEDPLYFYRLIYEDNALKYISEKYKNKIIYNSFDDLIVQIERIFTYEKSRMGLVFLKESFPTVWKILESILICDNHSFLYTSLYQCLKTDILGLSRYYKRLAKYSNEFIWCCKEVIRSYVRTNLAGDIKDIHAIEKNQIVFFSLFIEKIRESYKIINSCFPNENLCDDIFIEKCNELKTPDFDERLVLYSAIVMNSNEYHAHKPVLYQCLQFISNKTRFSELYYAELKKKLLDFKHNYTREFDFIFYLKPYVEPQFYRKYSKMIKDIELSLQFNDNLIFAKDYQNELNCFVTILNYSAWSLDDKDLYKEVILPPKFEKYKKWIDKHYNLENSDRTLIWVWDKGYVVISMQTDKEYTFKMNIFQYIIFSVIYNNDNVLKKYIEDSVKLKSDDVSGIILILMEHNLVVCNHDAYSLNCDFSSSVTEFSLEKLSYVIKIKNESCVDLKLYYKAKIVRLLKRSQKLEIDEIKHIIENEHLEEYEFNEEYISMVINELENNGYIEVNGTSLLYEP